MKVAIGGTFSVLHKGHRALLDKAFEVGDEVAIGLMSDEYAARHKIRMTPMLDRRSSVIDYAETKGKPYAVHIIDSSMGEAARDGTLDAIVVSPETIGNVAIINAERERRGLKRLMIVQIGHVLADDWCPISSTRVLDGEVDLEGHLNRPLVVHVGSVNPVKMEAVRNIFSHFFPELEIEGSVTHTSVPDEPWEDDVKRGAKERAWQVMQNADIGVGIEAGLFRREDGIYDVQYCAILDKMGRYTFGTGPGFRYPSMIESELLKGLTVGDVFAEKIVGESIGRKGGAIGFLTNGVMKRQELTESAVLAAMVPRIKKELYFES
ncbi:MAG TPA: inosine/xanthosine triphosphatase [Methanomassiliicoccales archaeon]|jgi:inosine/xanthosine triphosphatase